MLKQKNPLNMMLQLLNVKHTRQYTNRYYNEHPYKNNMFGLSQMLRHYGVSNKGFIAENKTKVILKLNVPFVAHIGNHFVPVIKIENDTVTYFQNGIRLTKSKPEFEKIWSGVSLIAETDATSIEPDYKKHRIDELIEKTFFLLFCVAIMILTCASVIYNHQIMKHVTIILLLLNYIGLYISYLLVLKQLNINNSHADKICSMIKKGNCNDIIQSSAAKIMGVVSWSEIGLSYFLSNTMVLLFTPHILSYIILLNICVLPYTIWSVWYQKTKAKQWCVLCLIVQFLLWSIFLTSLLFNFITIPVFSVTDLLFLGGIFSVTFVVVYEGISLKSEALNSEQDVKKYNELKFKEVVFKSLLKEKYYETEGVTKIRFGNFKSKNIITIITNPLCQACILAHEKIKFLQNDNPDVCFQFVFSTLGQDISIPSSKFLLASYFKNGEETGSDLFDDWYIYSNKNRGKLFNMPQYKVTEYQKDQHAKNELDKHTKWIKDNKINSTPVVLVNGYLFPNNY